MKWYKHELYNDEDDRDLLEYLNKLSKKDIESKDIKINFGSNYTIIYYYYSSEIK